MAFVADPLDGGSAHPRVGGGKLEEAAHPLNAWVSACLFEDGALAHRVVHDDERARPREPDRPLEIAGGARLSASMEIKSKGASAARLGSVSSARPTRISMSR